MLNVKYVNCGGKVKKNVLYLQKKSWEILRKCYVQVRL